MSPISLFEPISLGSIQLKNRIVMSPMTRARADAKGVLSSLAETYYRQRATAGLIISEATCISPNGAGYARVPGIWSDKQINAWKQITDAVHTEGGKIICQLMHVGRVAHPDNKPKGAETIAPSAIQVSTEKIYTDTQGLQSMAMPRAIETHEIPIIIEEYKQATLNAFNAGFDGVELHAAAGYLPAQFLSTNTNQRTDKYGGSVQNRIRFVIETLEAIISVRHQQVVGMRVWPEFNFNEIFDDNSLETHIELLRVIEPLKLDYVHSTRTADASQDILSIVRRHFSGTSMVNGGFSFVEANEKIVKGEADIVAFGAPFIANPNLVERFQQNITLNTADEKTYYTPGAEGYTDYC